MRVAMVGLGDIAQKAYLPVVASRSDITPLICTRNQQVLDQVQRQYRVGEAYSDFAQLLHARPDVVMVHSSTASHYDIVKHCLLAGIPVFVDKPLSNHLRECAELVELAGKKNVPLSVGFNRRFAPLYQQLLGTPALYVFYQKNRVNLPAAARDFVFDDFIHVLDFVRFCAGAEPEDFQLFHRADARGVGFIQVQWQHRGALYTASMNRLNGLAEEQLTYASLNEHWEIRNLADGRHYQNGSTEELHFGDWEPTLAKRGFVAMIDHLVEAVKHNQSLQSGDDILATHTLCEDVVARIG